MTSIRQERTRFEQAGLTWQKKNWWAAWLGYSGHNFNLFNCVETLVPSILVPSARNNAQAASGKIWGYTELGNKKIKLKWQFCNSVQQHHKPQIN